MGGIASLSWWYAANPFPAVRSLWYPSEDPWCWIGKVCVDDDGGPCPMVRTGSTASTVEGLDFDGSFRCVYCTTRDCLERWYSSDTFGGITSREFCPTQWNQKTCSD